MKNKENLGLSQHAVHFVDRDTNGVPPIEDRITGLYSHTRKLETITLLSVWGGERSASDHLSNCRCSYTNIIRQSAVQVARPKFFSYKWQTPSL